jgi:hypothetical protein
LRKTMKRQNTKSDVLTIGTVCCGHRKVAWIQNLFQLLARLQIFPLETRGMVGILFAKTDRSLGRHSTIFMMPLRYTIHLHIMNYIMFALHCHFSRIPVVQYQMQHQMCLSIFDVCRTVHHNILLQWNQPDAQYLKMYFILRTTLYMFRAVSPSIIRRLRLYIQHQVYVIQVLWPLANKQPKNLYDRHLMLYVQS